MPIHGGLVSEHDANVGLVAARRQLPRLPKGLRVAEDRSTHLGHDTQTHTARTGKSHMTPLHGYNAPCASTHIS